MSRSLPKYQKTKYPGIYRRGGTFAYRIARVRRPDGTTGDVWKGGFRTARDAREARNEAMDQIKKKIFARPTKITVATFLLDRWLPQIQVRESTKASYEVIIKKHIIPAIGHHRLLELDPDDLNRMYGRLSKSGRKDGNGLSDKSVRNIHVVIRKALEDARRWNLLPRNVAALADPPKQPEVGSVKMKTWDREELRSFLEFVREDRLYAAYRLAAMTGMRRGEVLGLRWQDVDFHRGRIAVRQTLVSVDYDVRFSTPKTKRSRRSIPLDAETVGALKAYKAQRSAEKLSFGPGYQDTGLVFSREDGTVIHPVLFSQWFDGHVLRAGLSAIRLHDLRHTYATLALQAGIHVKVVSERLGHATVGFTLDIYSHAIPAMQEEAAETFARLVLGSSSQ
jgi:integrase